MFLGLQHLIWKFWLNLVWNFDKIPVVAISLQNTVSTIWKTWNKLSIYFFSIFILLYKMAGSRIADPILKLKCKIQLYILCVYVWVYTGIDYAALIFFIHDTILGLWVSGSGMSHSSDSDLEQSTAKMKVICRTHWQRQKRGSRRRRRTCGMLILFANWIHYF